MKNQYGQKKARHIKILFVFLAALLVLAMGTVWFLKRRSGGGVVVLPEQAITVTEPVYFMQKDPEWAADRLGTSKDTMAGSGCLVTSLASGLDMQAREEARNFHITPGELNKALTAADAYTEGGAVIWNKVQSALPETDVWVGNSVKTEQLDERLEQGCFPVVKVRVGGVGAYHWVLLVGAENGHYLCMDPLSKGGKPVSLASFADRVYAVRAVFFAE